MDDTISTDPKRLAEAMKIAQEAPPPPPPKLTYSALQILREAWDRIIDPKYVIRPYEVMLREAQAQLGTGEVLGALTEAECRDFAEALMWRGQAQHLQKAAEEARQKCEILQNAAILKLCAKRDKDPKTNYDEVVDLTSGYIRRTPKKVRNAILRSSTSDPMTVLQEALAKLNKG